MRAARVLQIDQKNLLCGLDWIPILAESTFSRAQARRLGASLQVWSGQPAAALGLARGVPARGRYWSAADLWARLHPNASRACILPLDEQVWHVLASHQGVALVRADRSFPSLELAQASVDAMRLACPGLEQIPEPDAPGVHALLQGLARMATPGLAMKPVRGSRVRRLGVAAGVALGAAAWLHTQAAPEPPALDGVAPELLWRQAFDQALADRPVQGAAGTQALLQALYNQPVRLAGWDLLELHCQPRSGGLTWSCRADYRRQAQDADNRGFLQHAPSPWALDFSSLDTVRALWSFAVPAHVARPAALPAAQLVTRDWASALQASLPAFHRLHLEPARSLPLLAPLDARGQALTGPPAGLPAISLRRLQVEGPLRSGFLLAPMSDSVSWHKVSLVVAPGVRPDVRTSRLTLRMEGDIYEIGS
ncbi:hypothetical protein [Castellaniella sp.]|uniref:hypothetical protein n=1 Tax=Castellaniella sp. TaxID=1955812 RepID=UPI0035675C68